MTTRSRARAVGLSLTLAVVVLTSACNDPKPPAPASPTSTTAATTSATTSTRTESSQEKGARLAGEAVVKFWAKVNELGNDPKKPLTSLAEVAGGQSIAQWQVNLSNTRGSGYRYVGSTSVEQVQVAAYDPTANLYTVTACVDVSELNVVDKAGKSVVKPGRPPRVQYTHQVTKGKDGLFRVTQDIQKQGATC